MKEKTKRAKPKAAPATERVATAIRGHLDEWLDGYIVIAFDTEGSPIVTGKAVTAKDALALNNILNSVVSRGGISVTASDK